MTEPVYERSAGGLLSDVMSNVSNLLRNEVDLARAEVSDNLQRAGLALGTIAAAAVIAMVALNVLAAALVAALTAAGIDGGWAALIVGVVLAVVALGLLSKGFHDLKLSKLAPTRTMENVQRDATAVRDSYNEH